MVCILTGGISGSFLSIFVPLTAGPEAKDNNNYYNSNEGSDASFYNFAIPASQTQRLRVILTGNSTIKIFNNLAQTELNNKYIC